MREGLEVTQLVNADLKLNYGWRQRTFRTTSNAINRKQLSNQTASRKTPISGIKKSKMLIAMAKT